MPEDPRPTPDPVGDGQESVWDYPRPPRLERTDERVTVEVAGTIIASTDRPWRVLETSHPPVYYVPREDVDDRHVVEVAAQTFCEFKGVASYLDVVVGNDRRARSAWTYLAPASGFELMAGAIAFYPQHMDVCRVDGEVVRAVEGDFYGGWITSRVVGPFKGGPGTRFW